MILLKKPPSLGKMSDDWIELKNLENYQENIHAGV